jgi:hypothetical protein
MAPLPLAPAYREAIKVAVVLQVLLTLVLLTVVDGGRLAKVPACAMAGFWVGAAVVMMRRPRAPRPLDLAYIRWGYIAALAAGVAIGSVLTEVRG